MPNFGVSFFVYIAIKSDVSAHTKQYQSNQ